MHRDTRALPAHVYNTQKQSESLFVAPPQQSGSKSTSSLRFFLCFDTPCLPNTTAHTHRLTQTHTNAHNSGRACFQLNRSAFTYRTDWKVGERTAFSSRCAERWFCLNSADLRTKSKFLLLCFDFLDFALSCRKSCTNIKFFRL